eukprot:3445200-Amphidinium_carterae.1
MDFEDKYTTNIRHFSQYNYDGSYKQNPKQGRSPYEALKEQSQIEQGDESMVNMAVHNSSQLPT